MPKKNDIVGILRRLDMDGDSRISLKEFELGLKPIDDTVDKKAK